MKAGRLIILRVASLLEGRGAQNERDKAASAQQQQLRRSSSSVEAGAPSQQQLRRSSTLVVSNRVWPLW